MSRYYIPFHPLARRSHRRMMTDHEVVLVNDSMLEFYVKFRGPRESISCMFVSHSQARMKVAFGRFTWSCRMHILTSHRRLVDRVCFSAHMLGFVNRIFHPNVDEMCVVTLFVLVSAHLLTPSGRAPCAWMLLIKLGARCMVRRCLFAYSRAQSF